MSSLILFSVHKFHLYSVNFALIILNAANLQHVWETWSWRTIPYPAYSLVMSIFTTELNELRSVTLCVLFDCTSDSPLIHHDLRNQGTGPMHSWLYILALLPLIN